MGLRSVKCTNITKKKNNLVIIVIRCKKKIKNKDRKREIEGKGKKEKRQNNNIWSNLDCDTSRSMETKAIRENRTVFAERYYFSPNRRSIARLDRLISAISFRPVTMILTEN